MQTVNRNHFSEESKSYRAKVRKVFHEAGLHSDFRNKRVGGYTDKYMHNSKDIVQICKKLGIEYSLGCPGVIVYLPNQN
jgi:hypothetical protein